MMQNTMRKRYKIVSKTRFTIFMAVMILIAGMIFTSIIGLNNASSLTEIQYKQIEVSGGDTLWSIASAYMPQDQDVRQSVYDLCKINNVTADTLTAGQTILIPIYE